MHRAERRPLPREQGIRAAIENPTPPGAATLADAVAGAGPGPPDDDATVVVLAN